MKKLTFKDVAPDRILDYDTMSKIRGGTDEYGWETGTCGIKWWTHSGAYGVKCNISKSEMETFARSLLEFRQPYWWCCDSCATSSYCGDGSDGY